MKQGGAGLQGPVLTEDNSAAPGRSCWRMQDACVEVDMSAHTEVRSGHLSPGLVALLGLLLMLAAFVVDVFTDPTAAHAAEPSVAEQPAG
jgi:hypothetical protein